MNRDWFKYMIVISESNSNDFIVGDIYEIKHKMIGYPFIAKYIGTTDQIWGTHNVINFMFILVVYNKPVTATRYGNLVSITNLRMYDIRNIDEI